MANTKVNRLRGEKKSAVVRGTSHRIAELASNLEARLSESVEHFTRLNIETRFVALNARIEAARAGGESGRAFDVVAQAIQDISLRTGSVAENLSNEFSELLHEMREITHELTYRTRGERLSNLALTNIDVIDRNLYERSCDVRWWATDASIVEALSHPNKVSLAQASTRMGQILDSYTVYFDIAIVDIDGRVLANGRPHAHRSVGSQHAEQNWFKNALKTSNGTQYAQSEIQESSLCVGERVMIFACTVREGGRANGGPLGVLAIVFRWDALTQTVIERTPLSAEEWQRTRVCIVDPGGMLLADSARKFGTLLSLPGWSDIVLKDRGYCADNLNGTPHCVAHARSPGYETYHTGWYSLLLQENTH